MFTKIYTHDNKHNRKYCCLNRSLLGTGKSADYGICVRTVRCEDVKEVLEMIEELAVFEKLCGDPQLSVEGTITIRALFIFVI